MKPRGQEHSFSLAVARRAWLPPAHPLGLLLQKMPVPSSVLQAHSHLHVHQATRCPGPASHRARSVSTGASVPSLSRSQITDSFQQKPPKSSPENTRRASDPVLLDWFVFDVGHTAARSARCGGGHSTSPREGPAPNPPWRTPTEAELAVQTHMVHHFLQATAERAPADACEALLRLGEGHGPDARRHPKLPHHGVGDARDLPQVVLSPCSGGSRQRFSPGTAKSGHTGPPAQAQAPGEARISSRLLRSLTLLSSCWCTHVGALSWQFSSRRPALHWPGCLP